MTMEHDVMFLFTNNHNGIARLILSVM